MSMIGHNRGPSMEAGEGFRRLSWSKARAELMPKLPLEIVRLRVARAKRLGLPYKTYASIRAASGRDVVAFLFSGNALELRPQRIMIPDELAERLEGLPADRLGAIYAPLVPDDVRTANPNLIDGAGRAPAFTSRWRDARTGLRQIARSHTVPLDGVVVVAATEIEREWSDIAGFAGAVRASTFFDKS